MVVTLQPQSQFSVSRVAAGGGISAVRRRVAPLTQVPHRRPILGSQSFTPMKQSNIPTVDSNPTGILGRPLLPPVAPTAENEAERYTIVFDLDETLVSNRNPCGPAVLRPHVRDLLTALRGQAEVVLWTASIESVGKPVLRQLDPEGNVFQHAIYRHRSWFKEGTFFAKDLRLLGRNLDRTVIVENTPQCVRLNREHGIIVPNFFGNRSDDPTLLRLKDLLLELIQSRESVPRYLAASMCLVRTNETGGPVNVTHVAPRGSTWYSGMGRRTVGATVDSPSAVQHSPPFFYRLKAIR